MPDTTPIIQSRTSYQVTSFADFRTKLDVDVEEFADILPQDVLREKVAEDVSGLTELEKEDRGYEVPVRKLTDLPRPNQEQVIDKTLGKVDGDTRAAILANRENDYLIIEGELVDTIVELSESTPEQLRSVKKSPSPEKSSV